MTMTLGGFLTIIPCIPIMLYLRTSKSLSTPEPSP